GHAHQLGPVLAADEDAQLGLVALALGGQFVELLEQVGGQRDAPGVVVGDLLGQLVEAALLDEPLVDLAGAQAQVAQPVALAAHGLDPGGGPVAGGEAELTLDPLVLRALSGAEDVEVDLADDPLAPLAQAGGQGGEGPDGVLAALGGGVEAFAG